MEGYWVSPKGEVLLIRGKHIQEVFRNPRKFGETEKTLADTYKKYNEPINSEGKAREEVLTRILKRGWLRIRERSNSWTVQVWKMTKKLNDALWFWGKTVIGSAYDKYAPVNVFEIYRGGSKQMKSISLSDLASGANVSEEVKSNNNFRVVESVDDFSDITYPILFEDLKIEKTVDKHIVK